MRCCLELRGASPIGELEVECSMPRRDRLLDLGQCFVKRTL
jgi:hypothetical protein